MTEEKQRFIQDLAKENNSLVRSMLKVRLKFIL